MLMVDLGVAIWWAGACGRRGGWVLADPCCGPPRQNPASLRTYQRTGIERATDVHSRAGAERTGHAGQSISKIYTTPLFFKMAQNLDLRCVLISDPGTLGAGAKTRLRTPKAVAYHEQPDYCRFMIGHSFGRMESRIKEFTPHCVCRPCMGCRTRRAVSKSHIRPSPPLFFKMAQKA